MGQHMHRETVSLSQMQDHAVLKDDELSPLVPAARCQRGSAASATANIWEFAPLDILGYPQRW
jgi:hypothetical protein